MANFAPYVETRTGSYRFDQEDRLSLAAMSSTLAYSSYSESDIPELVDPEGWTIIEDQGQQGSCQGNALASAVEQCHVREGGEVVQLSRQQAYIMSQRYDGIRGDQGSTLTGGVKVAMNDGLCLESVWPYPSRYSTAVPPGFANSVRYKTKGYTEIKDWLVLLTHLAKFGPVHIGAPWNASIDRQVANSGVIDSWPDGGGGHSVLYGGYTNVGWNGQALSDPRIKLANSWATRWGRKGWAHVTKRAFEDLMNTRWGVVIGHFGAPHPEISKPDYGG